MNETHIIQALLTFLQREDSSDDDFNQLALEIFAYQFAHNSPYRRFATQRGRTPLTVKNWRNIPAIPINAFKDLTLSCRPTEQIAEIFMTSGTTGTVKGRSYHSTLEVWKKIDAAQLPPSLYGGPRSHPHGHFVPGYRGDAELLAGDLS